MTAQELFLNLVIPLMGERRETSESYKEQFIPVLNIITVDCFSINNGLRVKRDKDILKEAPAYSDMQDILVYEDDLIRNVMTYGIASRLTIDDGEPNKTGFLEQNYASRYNLLTSANYEPMVDYYSERDGEADD